MIDLRGYLVANMAATALGSIETYTETKICGWCHGAGCPMCGNHGELPEKPVEPLEPDYDRILEQQGRTLC